MGFREFCEAIGWKRGALARYAAAQAKAAQLKGKSAEERRAWIKRFGAALLRSERKAA